MTHGEAIRGDCPFRHCRCRPQFRSCAPPVDFIDNPYRYYTGLRTEDPVHATPGGVLLTRYDDVVAVYRDLRASSDRKIEFKPKLGTSPLYEHHTTSLVFNDPPLHTRRSCGILQWRRLYELFRRSVTD